MNRSALDSGDSQSVGEGTPNLPSERTAASEQPVGLATVVAQQGALERLWLWFWRADVQPTPRQPEHDALLARARAAADVARRTEREPEPFQHDVSPVICELYRESIHWSLLALSGPFGRESLQADVVQRTLPNVEQRTRVEGALRGGFEDFARLAQSEREALLIDLRRSALALLTELEGEKRAVEAVWVQRSVRVGLLVAVCAVIGLASLRLLDRVERSRDLAVAAPWHTSSVYGGGTSCRSPLQECPESPEYFFHTQEEQAPWIEFDLGSAQRISGTRVDNRADCCVDRAAPMIVEVSTDQLHWRKVARRDTSFAIWRASFEPVSARWIRFRLDKRDSLHLRGVRILRAAG